VHERELAIDLVEAPIHRIEALIHRVDAPVGRVQPPVDALEAGRHPLAEPQHGLADDPELGPHTLDRRRAVGARGRIAALRDSRGVRDRFRGVPGQVAGERAEHDQSSTRKRARQPTFGT
jgi:hypothetical protein